MHLTKAFGHTLRHNTVKALPIVIVWTVIWFVLSIIQAMMRDKENTNDTLSAKSAAKTLAGYGHISFSTAFFQWMQKGIRMVVFLILPAIAWDGLGFWKATKRGLGVFRAIFPNLQQASP